MAPTDNDKGKSLPKSFRPSMYLCGKTVNFEKDPFSVWFVHHISVFRANVQKKGHQIEL